MIRQFNEKLTIKREIESEGQLENIYLITEQMSFSFVVFDHLPRKLEIHFDRLPIVKNKK